MEHLLGKDDQGRFLREQMQSWVQDGGANGVDPEFQVEEKDFEYSTHDNMGAAHAPMLTLLKASPLLFTPDALHVIVRLQGMQHPDQDCLFAALRHASIVVRCVRFVLSCGMAEVV